MRYAGMIALIAELIGAVYAQADDQSAVGIATHSTIDRSSDVVYGRKFGMALTMDVFKPKGQANGAAVIVVMSGGWVSDNQSLNKVLVEHWVTALVQRGYTVFAVFHGSQPKFTIPEAISDLNRAVRYVRHHSSRYEIDPNRLGITGASAGGHLSLMQGTAGGPGLKESGDPVDRESSRVQAVACLFPPTDFLNYGGPNQYAFAPDGVLALLSPAVDARELDPKTGFFERTIDQEKRLALAKEISPISHVSGDDPPTLIVHGDKDKLVPVQQAESFVAALKGATVPAELIMRKGRDHDFVGVAQDVQMFVQWFDAHLKAN